MGEEIDFTKWPIMLSEIEQLIGNEWSYSTSSGGKINSFTKATTSKDITIQVFASSKEEYKKLLNDFTRITETDVENETLGRLEVNDYYLLCYITGWDYEELEEDFYTADKKIKVTAEKWIWNKETRYEFIHDDIQDTSGRGYPYGYDYDYAIGSGYIDSLNNSHFGKCDFVMEISGYAIEPAVTIGGHIYRVNEIIQTNETLTIDSRKKTIFLTKNNGVQVNLFSKRDKSSYIFEKILPGENRVYWNNGFDFKMTLYEERGEPRWI